MPLCNFRIGMKHVLLNHLMHTIVYMQSSRAAAHTYARESARAAESSVSITN